MDDKEWAAGIEAALNQVFSCNNDCLPGAWAALRNLAQQLPVDIAIVKRLEWDEQTKAVRCVSVTARGAI